MTEQFKDNDALKIEKEKIIRRRLELTFELVESGEVFPFQGLKAGAYERLKEADTLDSEGYVTPIDELLRIYEAEGVRVGSGMQMRKTERPPSTITVAPAVTGPGFYGENLLHMKNLDVVEGMDERLSELIRLSDK
jgi:hypothetical protein